MTPSAAIALTILVLTYVGVAAGRIPGLRLNRAGFAFLGGAAMIALGPMKLDEAFRAIELDTIAMLTGMMIVVAHLKVSGAFRLLGGLVIRHAHAPVMLLITVTALSGVLSAFLVNDAICLVMTPIVLQVMRRAQAQSNSLSHRDRHGLELRQRRDHHRQSAEYGDRRRVGDSFASFALMLAPVAIFGLVAGVVIVWVSFRKEFSGQSQFTPVLRTERVHKGQVIKACVVSVGLAVALFAGAPPAEAALLAGAVLLFTRSIKPERIFAEIDGPLLILFAGLFIVVAGAEKAFLTPERIALVQNFGLDIVWRLSALTAVLSNIVSNVPAVLILRPFIPGLHDPTRAWLVVAMASTLAGNLTLIGSVANLIVAQGAESEGSPISFWAYFKIGLPLTLVTLAAGTAWLTWV